MHDTPSEEPLPRGDDLQDTAETAAAAETEAEPQPASSATPWDLARRVYAARYPGVKNENVLALIWKLDEDPRRNLADIRPELEAFGLNPSARALGSARQELGLIPKKPRRSRTAAPADAGTGTEVDEDDLDDAPPAARRRDAGRDAGRGAGFSVKDLTGDELRRMLAGGDAEVLVQAMERAIAILQDAVDQHRAR